MKEEIEKSIKELNQSNTFVYPTDTVWGIGCDATSEKAVENIYNIKERSESKSLIVLVNSIDMLRKYVKTVPQTALDILSVATKPTTIIYNNPIGFAKNCVANDNTIAIRIVKDEFCNKLISKFGKPIISTSANISGNPTPKSFKDIDTSILERVDYAVNLHRNKLCDSSSTILRINSIGKIIVIRE